MDCALLPSPLPAASLQLTGYMLLKSAESSSGWLVNTSELLKRPETASFIVDAEFLRQTPPEQFSELVQALGRSAGNTIAECHVDLRQLQPQNLEITTERVTALLGKDGLDGKVRKMAIFGMTSRYESILSALPPSLIDLQLFFEEDHAVETNDEEPSDDEERDRRDRIENMIEDYVAIHPNLTSLTIKHDENSDELLPLSAYALASLIGCPMIIKIELQRCAISSDHDDGNIDRDPPEQAVFSALRDNTTLFLLRFRTGSLATSIAENIARAIEVGNRNLRYIDMGDQEGVGDSVAAGMAKAVLRNPVLQGMEMNLNSIQDFQFASLGNLTCMDLSDNYLRDEGALQLAQLIPACRLERFNLAENGIGQIGGCAIAWSLMHNNTVSKINICNNPLLDFEAGQGPTSEVTTRVHNSFKDTPAYQQGFLGMLCSSLRHNKTLSFINLANTGLNDAHGPLLAILLRVGSLDGLGLLRNNIGDQACIYMCQALSKYRTTLRVLMLEMNPISARGFYAMWKGVLAANDTLVSVSWGKQVYQIEGMERGQRDLDTVLRLNRAGMIRLRRDKNATRDQWIEALAELTSDLDCSFLFLSENPSFSASVAAF